MNILIYRLVSRRPYRAVCIANVWVPKQPDNLDEFAAEHDGDFAQVDWSAEPTLPEPAWQN